jgi:hypothetical protein
MREVHVRPTLRPATNLTVEAYQNAMRPGEYMACARDERGWMHARTYGWPTPQEAQQAIIDALSEHYKVIEHDEGGSA